MQCGTTDETSLSAVDVTLLQESTDGMFINDTTQQTEATTDVTGFDFTLQHGTTNSISTNVDSTLQHDTTDDWSTDVSLTLQKKSTSGSSTAFQETHNFAATSNAPATTGTTPDYGITLVPTDMHDSMTKTGFLNQYQMTGICDTFRSFFKFFV